MKNIAICLKNVSKKFYSQSSSRIPFYAVKNISLSIKTSTLTVIGGANGSGKSVLMQLVAGLLKLSDGSIFTESTPGLVFQDAATQILGQTPYEDVSVGPKNLKMEKNQIPVVVEDALKAVSLWDKKDFPAEFLSGGEKRRLAVASILAMNRNIIIFDEPYANLDYSGVKDVNALIKNLKSQGKTIIVLTHEIEKCLALCEHFIVLKDGEVVFDGEPEVALQENLEKWGIKNPLTAYNSFKDLLWE